jgi:hypothetical protein
MHGVDKSTEMPNSRTNLLVLLQFAAIQPQNLNHMHVKIILLTILCNFGILYSLIK